MTIAVVDTKVTEALRTVAINGAYNASRALSKWLRRGVRLTTDGFSKLSIADAATMVGEADEGIAAVHLPLSGDLSGHMLLAFPAATALALADMMMDQPEGTSTEFGELEQSCIEETGNIVCSAYANSLSKWLGLHVEPSVPTFAHDMACAIVDPMIMDTAAHQDYVLVANTEFMLDKQQLQWALMLLPSPDAMRIMEERCHLDSVRQNALQTIAVNGAFGASRAMSKWLKRGVQLSTDGFSRVGLSELGTLMDESEPIAALHMPLGAQLHGHAVLAIPQAHALRLVDILLDQPLGTTTAIGELEQSCLEETGNIISSSYVNSWSTWLDVHVEPGAPEFVIDLPAAVLDGIFAGQVLTNDTVFLARTEFTIADESLEWVFILLPTPAAMRLIETSCQ